MIAATVSTTSQLIPEIMPLIILVVVAAITIAGTWRIFVKMGEPGWKCVIPFYNEYIVFRTVWNTKAFWKMIGVSIAAGICAGITQILFESDFDIASFTASALSLILMIASLVYQVGFCSKVSKAFGKGVGMTIMLAIVPFIATLILGFGSAQYRGANR